VGQNPRYLPPSSEYWFGTDAQGRDVFTVLLYSLGQSLKIGFISGSVAFFIGLCLGLAQGYDSGIVGDILASITNVFLIIPTWPILVIVASSVFKMTVPMMSTIIALFSWPWSARGIASQVRSLKEQPFLELAKLNGENSIELLFKEIAPNMLPYLSVIFVRMISWGITNEVGLEIIGLGPQNTSTLGLMIYWTQYYGALATKKWWWVLPPVVCLVLIFLSLQVFTFGLDQIFNPRLRKG